MATFRHSQIDEILNYDRSMNRRVLDRTSAQVAMFNNQRAEPTQTDIKFEALISKLIDELTKNITNAIEGISHDQAQELRGDAFETILKKRTGETGLEGPVPNPTTSFLGLEDPKLVAKKQQAAQQQALADAQQAQQQSSQGVNPNEAHLYGFGRSRRAKHMYGGGPNDVSKVQIVRKTEDQLYDIISKYNGVIDKLIEGTQPNGRFGSPNNGSNSNVQFLASQLKQIVGPLKQLVFELSATQNFELQSQINLFDNMVKIVNNSPPFQKINISAYKNAPINYQGVNREEVINNPDGYLASLRKYRAGLSKSLEKTQQRLENFMTTSRKHPDFNFYFNKYRAIYDELKDVIARVDNDSLEIANGYFPVDKRIWAELTRQVKGIITDADKLGMPKIDGDPFAGLAPGPSQIDLGDVFGYEPLPTDVTASATLALRPQQPVQPDLFSHPLFDRPVQPGSSINGMGRGKKSGKGKPLADYLADPIQQYNRMGRPLTNDDYAELQERANRTKFRANIPLHYTDIGSLYPFYAKNEDTKYAFPAKLRKELSTTKPRRNALGADLSLLQGRIGGPTKHVPEPKKAPRRKTVTQAEATMNILEGRGRKNPKALHKLAFNDEKNEMFN